MVRGHPGRGGAAERAAVHVNAIRVDSGPRDQRRVRGVGRRVQSSLVRPARAPAVARIVDDQDGRAGRLKLPHDGPDRGDGLAVTVKPEEAGGGWRGWRGWRRLGKVASVRNSLPRPPPTSGFRYHPTKFVPSLDTSCTRSPFATPTRCGSGSRARGAGKASRSWKRHARITSPT